MTDGTDFVYIIIDKSFTGEIVTRAICVGKEDYDAYVKTHDVNGSRTLVVNPENPKFKNSEEFMDNVYSSSYTIVDYFDDVPVTGYEEEMLIEAEGTFHPYMLSRLGDIRTILSKNFLKLSKSEKKDIETMLEIIKSKSSMCTDEEDICEEEPYDRINYKELIKHGGILS